MKPSPDRSDVRKSSLKSKKSVKIAIDPHAVRLAMRVEDGDENLLKPSTIIFNSYGLENCKSHRKAYDGITYFGAKK